MQVFRVYFRIIKANLKLMSIYFIIFILAAIFFSIAAAPKSVEGFSQTRINAAFVSLDEDTALVQGLKTYLENYVSYVEVENKQQKLQDALFYREVEYILTIPKGFTREFLQRKDVVVEKTAVPDSRARMYVDMAINKYLNTARVYSNTVPEMTEEKLVEAVSESLSAEVQVDLRTFGVKKEGGSFAVSYFNYLAYSLLALLILGVGANLRVFNDKNLKRRNLCSPMKHRSFSMQLIAANLVFGLLCYGSMIILAFLLKSESMMTYKGILLCVNALVFMIAALSMSFLVGNLIKSREAQSAIANTLSVGLSFVSGVFIPQELLSDRVLTIASFSPIYWYVRTNNGIGLLSSFDMNNLSSLFIYMLIQLGFAAAIFSVALVISKQKRIANS